MSLEVIVSADIEELKKGIAEAELELERLKKQKSTDIKLGLDVTNLQKQINESKSNLSDLRKALSDAGKSADGFGQKVKGGGNTLTQFSRIAQDAPFGIMGIGNNLTATAEAFASLSKEAGGAGGALKAVGASLMGSGGVLLAVSLVTTALTVMSQKGLTVQDVFAKMTGTFDEFGASLREANKEAAKNAAEQVASVGAYVSAAKDINLSMQERLIAVKKLQDEYPAFFGNLTKEQILNGNVAGAVKEVTEALKAKARAQAYAGKLGDLAAKEVELRDKEAELIKVHNKELEKRNELNKKLTSEQFNESTFKAWQQADRALKTYSADLKEVQNGIRANSDEMDKWAAKSTVEVKASIKLDFEPEKQKKAKKVKELQKQVSELNKLNPLGLDSLIKVDTGDPFIEINKRIEASLPGFIDRLNKVFKPGVAAVYYWKDTLTDAFTSIGDSIGQALASGGNVLQSIGMSLLGTLGSLLSDIGKKLIALGVASVAGSSVLATLFTPAGIAAGIAAIGVGTALVAGGSFLGNVGKNQSGGNSGMGNISTGGSVASPKSSISSNSGGGGYQNVVFEISGQSLVGVLSNTLNKNVKLGGVPAI